MALEEACYNISTRESRETYRERLSVFPQGFLVIDKAGRLEGAICSEIWPLDTEIVPETFALGHSIRKRHSLSGGMLYISSLAVDPASRGQGRGTMLFTSLLERIGKAFPQLKKAILLVNEDWKPAQRIYLRHGFKETGRFPAFFRADNGEGRDGIVMGRGNTT
jgi:ribosomal-protein-alanine N-acetyltransferase